MQIGPHQISVQNALRPRAGGNFAPFLVICNDLQTNKIRGITPTDFSPVTFPNLFVNTALARRDAIPDCKKPETYAPLPPPYAFVTPRENPN